MLSEPRLSVAATVGSSSLAARNHGTAVAISKTEFTDDTANANGNGCPLFAVLPRAVELENVRENDPVVFTLRLLNLSDHIIRVSGTVPRSKLFRHKDPTHPIWLQFVAIAPGLSSEVQITFHEHEALRRTLFHQPSQVAQRSLSSLGCSFSDEVVFSAITDLSACGKQPSSNLCSSSRSSKDTPPSTPSSFRVIVPLRASPPSPQITIIEGSGQLGTLYASPSPSSFFRPVKNNAINPDNHDSKFIHVCTKQIILRNNGYVPARVELLEQPDAPYSVTTSSEILYPTFAGFASEIAIAVRFAVTGYGLFQSNAKFSITPYFDDQAEEIILPAMLAALKPTGAKCVEPFQPQIFTIPLEATLLSQRVDICMTPSTSLESLRIVTFPTLFFNQQTSVAAHVINRGPNVIRFAILPTEQSAPQTFLAPILNIRRRGFNEDIEESEDKVAFRCSPSESTVHGNKTFKVEFNFHPRRSAPHHGWQNNLAEYGPHDYYVPMQARLYMLNEIQTIAESEIEFVLKARAVPLLVKLSRNVIHFGDAIKQGQSSKQSFSISNIGNELPVRFSIKKIANYHIHPSKGVIHPKEEIQIEVEFCPHQIGNLSCPLNIILAKGLQTATLDLQGHCIPSTDIIKELQQISTTHFARLERRQSLHQLQPSQFAEERNTHVLHHRGYQAFLNQSQTQRIEKATRKIFEGFRDEPLNLGLEPASGLIPPDPVQNGDENALDFYTHLVPLGPKIQNLLIRLKDNIPEKITYSSLPQDAKVREQIEKPLSPNDLAQIVASVQSLSFKTVSASSVHQRSFNILNALDVYVHVQLQPPTELELSFPRTQIIPPKSMATFHVLIKTSEPGQKSIPLPYIINERHQFAIRIHGDVMSMCLQLSKTELNFSIHPDVKDGDHQHFSVEENLMLTNPGTDQAYFCVSSINNNTSLNTTTIATTNSNNINKITNSNNNNNNNSNQVKNGGNNNNIGTSAKSEAFSVTPAAGWVAPGQSLPIVVSFMPLSRASCNETIIFQVQDGNPIALQCKGEVPPINLVTSVKDIDFGIVAVDHVKQRSFRVRNVSQNDGLFVVPAISSGYVEVTPQRGCIAAGSSVEIMVKVHPPEIAVYERLVVVQAIGGRSIRMPIKFKGEMSDIRVDPVDLGVAYVGSITVSKLTLRNMNAAAAQIAVDLTGYEDFMISTSSLTAASGFVSELSSTSSSSSPSNLLTKKAFALRNSKDAQVANNNTINESANESAVQKRYVFEVPGNSSLVLDLYWHPTYASEFQYHMPGFLKGPSGTSVSVTIPVRGRAVEPALNMSLRHVSFGHHIVRKQGDGIDFSFLAHPNSVIIRLQCQPPHQSIRWWVIGSSTPFKGKNTLIGNDKAFSVEPQKGVVRATLKPPDTYANDSVAENESSVAKSASTASSWISSDLENTLRVRFEPGEPGHFEAQIQIGFTVDDKTEMKLDPIVLNLDGIGMEATLALDPPVISFPTVPLGVPVTVVMNIINYGIHRSIVKAIVPADFQVLPIVVSFPEGDLLRDYAEALPVTLTFSSSFPISVSGKIEFKVGEDPQSYFLPISATADNSLITNHAIAPLFSGNSARPRPAEKDGISHDRKALLNVDFIASSISPLGLPISENGDDLDVSKKTLQHCLEMGHILHAWLQHGFMLNNAAISEFPGSLIASDGRLLHDLIQNLMSKRTTINLPTQLTMQSPSDRCTHLIRVYDEILGHLRSIGAHLSSIKPEFLLSKEDYSEFKRKNKQKSVQPEEHTHYWQFFEDRFEIMSMQAWTIIVLQIIKVLVVSRITMSVKGSKEPTSQSELISNHEASLLLWISNQANKVSLENIVIENFTRDLSSGIIFANVIMAHAPQARELFRNIIASPKSNQEKLHNANIVLDVLKSLIGTTIPMSAERIVNANAVDMIIFCSYLHQTLPQLLPKASLEFVGALHETVSQFVELSNPTPSMITYSIYIAGPKDFHVKEKSIHIPAKSSTKLQVDYTSRFSKPTKGTLILRSRRVGFGATSILLFSLSARIERINPRQCYQVDAPVYNLPASSIGMDVNNIFNEPGNFKVIASEEFKRDEIDGEIPKMSNSLPPAFSCQAKQIRLLANQTFTIPVSFLPFEMGTYTLHVIFIDEQVGEFHYEIKGIAKSPLPMETLQWTGKISSENVPLVARISPYNPAREDALAAAIAANNATNSGTKEASISSRAASAIQADKKVCTYKISFVGDFLNGPSETLMTTAAISGIRKSKSKELPNNELGFFVRPRAAGKCSGFIVLQGLDVPDVRVVAVECLVVPNGVRAILEMKSAVLETVQHEIPIMNNSEEDWTFRATLQAKDFSGPGMVVVRKQSTATYPISFRPTHIGEIHGQLMLTNVRTEQEHVYTLKGNGLPPQASGQINIRCQAREKVVRILRIPNLGDGEVEYQVTSTFGNALHGAATCKVGINGFGIYNMELRPKCSGAYSGSITFTNPKDGLYVWFQVDLNVDPPPAQEQLHLRSIVRQEVHVDLEIANPRNDAIEYLVSFSGEGLKGNTKLYLQPQESKVYSLHFLPMVSGTQTGVLSFRSELVGEFWYELQLIAEDSAPIDLPPMQCEIGKSSTQIIEIANPLPHEELVTIKCNNNHEYRVLSNAGKSDTRQPSIRDHKIPANGRVQLSLVFQASSLTEEQSCEIIFEGSRLGRIIYRCKGTGLLPTDMAVTEVSSVFAQTHSGFFAFVNPLRCQITVGIRFVENREGSGFQILSKRTSNIILQPERSLEIPFIFHPTCMQVGLCCIEILESSGLKWVYPLRGIPEMMVSEGGSWSLVAQARKRIEKTLQLPIAGLPSLHEDRQLFLRVLSQDEDKRSLVDRALGCTIEQVEWLKDDESIARATIKFVFQPTQAFHAPSTLEIYHASFGRWFYNFVLTAHRAELDGVLTVAGAMNKISSISFRIDKNIIDEMTFRAHFSPESSSEFSVSPTEGVLVPSHAATKSDNRFVVRYQPVKYGQRPVGTLIIEAQEKQWTYEIRGTIPTYRPPGASYHHDRLELIKDARLYVTSSDRARNSSYHTQQQRKRNFIRENASVPPLPATINGVRAIGS